MNSWCELVSFVRQIVLIRMRSFVGRISCWVEEETRWKKNGDDVKKKQQTHTHNNNNNDVLKKEKTCIMFSRFLCD